MYLWALLLQVISKNFFLYLSQTLAKCLLSVLIIRDLTFFCKVLLFGTLSW